MKTLEQYLRQEFARSGAIDFSIRAELRGDAVAFYIHPDSRDGDTRSYLVRENLLSRDPQVTYPDDHYPEGMREESRRLHREYNALVMAQRDGARNGADVARLTDECAAKGIILVPGGENL